MFIRPRNKLRTRNGEKQIPDKTLVILQPVPATELPHSHNLSLNLSRLLDIPALQLKNIWKHGFPFALLALNRDFGNPKELTFPFQHLPNTRTGWDRDVCGAANFLSVLLSPNCLGGREHPKIVTWIDRWKFLCSSYRSKFGYYEAYFKKKKKKD